MRIIQIVPRLPPAVDGVGDYAYHLALKMRQDFRVQTHFVVCHPDRKGNSNLDGFQVSRIDQRSVRNLFSLLSQHPKTPVLLHYVGYGYDKRGCPSWLIEALERWKHSNQTKASLVTMFHEISATGPVWTSAFWLSTLQKKLAERLVKESDVIFTSRQLYAEKLSELSRGKHTQFPVLPVFSSVGEPDETLPLNKRRKTIVVFGGKAKRLKVYQQSIDSLLNACEQLGIERIIDIGPAIDLDLSKVIHLPVQQIGCQPSNAISEVLKSSVAGFLAYNPNFLAKSTIFAAYCSHRTIPINSTSVDQTIDAIIPGEHYWCPDLQNSKSGTNLESLYRMQAIADNACKWYENHSLKQQAEAYMSCLL